MFEQVLSKKTRDVLALLAKQKFIKDFYLAGDTGLALQLGHRTSIDLDFFSAKQFNPKEIINRLSELGDFILEGESWGTINGRLNTIRVSLLFCLKNSKKFNMSHIT